MRYAALWPVSSADMADPAKAGEATDHAYARLRAAARRDGRVLSGSCDVEILRQHDQMPAPEDGKDCCIRLESDTIEQPAPQRTV